MAIGCKQKMTRLGKDPKGEGQQTQPTAPLLWGFIVL